jgi:hypothetical protein
MYAFALLHHYYHQFRQLGRLSGYHIGEGWMDPGEEDEARHGLKLARTFISLALKLETLFGKQGVDLFRTLFNDRFERGFAAASEALRALDKQDYTLLSMSALLADVEMAIDAFSSAISFYQMCRGKFILRDENSNDS